MKPQRTISLHVNGRPLRWQGDPDEPLLWVLRDRLGLRGTKYACGVGACGACMVHVDGRALPSCTLPVGTLGSRRVLTVEALARGDALHPVQQAWLEHQVPQCGYCQAGQMMAAAALLARHPAPTEAQIDDAMRGNLCRCGTYARIKPAVVRAAELMRRPGGAA
jgi:aerobic-type carbon monoxide dehydrogenase small subunit (CoxS/CutS family)